MSTLVARILLSLMIVPLGGPASVVTFVVVSALNRRSDETAFASAGAATWGFVATYWVCLWRRSVTWTPARVTWTLVGAALALLVGVAVGIGMMLVIFS